MPYHILPSHTDRHPPIHQSTNPPRQTRSLRLGKSRPLTCVVEIISPRGAGATRDRTNHSPHLHFPHQLTDQDQKNFPNCPHLPRLRRCGRALGGEHDRPLISSPQHVATGGLGINIARVGPQLASIRPMCAQCGLASSPRPSKETMLVIRFHIVLQVTLSVDTRVIGASLPA